MNKSYTLTNMEVWALATLVYLPVDGDSILGQWLAEFDQPPLDQVVHGAINTLEAKGIIDPQRSEDLVPEDLLESLLVLALSRIRITAALSRSGKRTWSSFGQLEDAIVQYDLDGETICIHPPDEAYEFSSVLVPDWFNITSQEELKDSLPVGAFIMLRTAMQLDGIKAVLEESEWGPVFSRSELIDAFSDSKGWVDIYSAVGISDVQPVSRMPIKEYFDLLYDRGYLQQAGSDSLQIGSKAVSLNAAYADPDLCVLTLSAEGVALDRPASGALVYGNGRLFLLRAERSGHLSFEQLSSTHTALGWASDLIARGSAVPAVVPDPPDIESLQGQSAPPAVQQEADDSFVSLPSYSEPVQAYSTPPASQSAPPPAAPPQTPVYQARAPQYQAPPKKKRSGCLTAAVVLVVLMLCAGLVIGGAVLIFGVSFPWDSITDVTTPQTAGQASVWVVNNSTDTICYFYISPAGEEDWGLDQLGAQETIPPGGTWTGSAMSGSMYDLAAFDCTNTMLGTQYGVTIPSEGITFTLSP